MASLYQRINVLRTLGNLFVSFKQLFSVPALSCICSKETQNIDEMLFIFF